VTETSYPVNTQRVIVSDYNDSNINIYKNLNQYLHEDHGKLYPYMPAVNLKCV